MSSSSGKLGKLRDFKRLFKEIIEEGAELELDEGEVKAKRKRGNKRVWALAKKLDRLVQRRGGEVLRRELPPKREYVLTLRLGETQRCLYNAVLGINSPELYSGGEIGAGRAAASTKQGGIFKLDQELRRVYNHPAALLRLHEQQKRLALK